MISAVGTGMRGPGFDSIYLQSNVSTCSSELFLVLENSEMEKNDEWKKVIALLSGNRLK